MYLNDLERFKSFINTQNLIRDIDQLYLINSKGELILSANNSEYIKIEDRAIEMVLSDDRPLKIINAPQNRSAAVIRLQNFDDTFLYVVQNLDKNISYYLLESEEAIKFLLYCRKSKFGYQDIICNNIYIDNYLAFIFINYYSNKILIKVFYINKQFDICI